MPYALFCNEARLSKAYPTEADVWKLARRSGLVVDTVSEGEKPLRPVLDNGYEIRPCSLDPQEDPAKNQAEAEREAPLEFRLRSQMRDSPLRASQVRDSAALTHPTRSPEATPKKQA